MTDERGVEGTKEKKKAGKLGLLPGYTQSEFDIKRLNTRADVASREDGE